MGQIKLSKEEFMEMFQRNKKKKELKEFAKKPAMNIRNRSILYPVIAKPKEKCIIEDCENDKFGSSDYCNKHRMRLLRYGDPNIVNKKGPKNKYLICRICGGPHRSRGLCENCYQKARRNGEFSEKERSQENGK